MLQKPAEADHPHQLLREKRIIFVPYLKKIRSMISRRNSNQTFYQIGTKNFAPRLAEDTSEAFSGKFKQRGPRYLCFLQSIGTGAKYGFTSMILKNSTKKWLPRDGRDQGKAKAHQPEAKMMATNFCDAQVFFLVTFWKAKL